MAGLSEFASRNVLCVFPHYTPSFGTFQHSYSLVGVQAFMPPQGLLIIAAALPENWSVRFVDENIRPATADDFRWADAVFVSGMHIQRRQINDICARAHGAGRVTVLGGPSVSAAPEHYGAFDYLHVGEIGDATDELVRRLAQDPSRPAAQVVLTTVERRALTEFPLPAYDLVELERYMLGSVQFSSGCPYQCEFCDIPALYGRNPRLKTPEQILAELDKLVDNGVSGFVYFVDDNFIGNRARRSNSCRIWSSGSAAAAIRCRSPARRR
jgi:hopanoid C-2 methylase